MMSLKAALSADFLDNLGDEFDLFGKENVNSDVKDRVEFLVIRHLFKEQPELMESGSIKKEDISKHLSQYYLSA